MSLLHYLVVLIFCLLDLLNIFPSIFLQVLYSINHFSEDIKLFLLYLKADNFVTISMLYYDENTIFGKIKFLVTTSDYNFVFTKMWPYVQNHLIILIPILCVYKFLKYYALSLKISTCLCC